jgi:hypothetical protein
MAKVKVEQAQERALVLAGVLGRFSPAEQKRAAQIVRGGITTQPDKYQAALESAEEFKLPGPMS